MNYVTLSGRLNTDPHFDPSSLRPGYQDLHDIEVDIDETEPIRDGALVVSYRAYVSYSDAGERKVRCVELLQHQSMDEHRRGRRANAYPLNPFDAAENGLLNLLMAHAGTKAAQQIIEDDIQRHQADRDEEFA